MKFRCAGVVDSCTDGLEYSPALAIFFQGCELCCKGCQNPELQSFDGGYDFYTEDIISHLERFGDFYKGVVFTGGDPIYQPTALFELLSKVNHPKVLYTGKLYDDIPLHIRDFLDIVVDGPYREELATNGFPASSNQRIIKKEHK